MIEIFALAQDVGAAARASTPPAGFLERLVTPLPGLAIIFATALAVQVMLRRRVWWGGVTLVIAMLALNWLLLTGGKIVQLELFIDLDWNWPGKIVAIAATLILIWWWPTDPARDLGVTFKQTPGSTKPVLTVFVVYCLSLWALEYWLGGAGDFTLPSAETLAFQATMPSLDEEPLFRGLALFVLARALGSPSQGGIWLGPAALALAVAFGLNHAVSFAGGLHFNTMAFALTGVFALVATWMRLRTGSLVFPLLLHSVSNLGLSFI